MIIETIVNHDMDEAIEIKNLICGSAC